MVAPAKIEKFVNGQVRKVKATDLDRDRVRFNWGYHDGASEAVSGVFPVRLQRWGADWQNHHHDPTYVAGWQIGYDDAKAGTYTNNSEGAWIRSGREGTEENVTAYRLS
jgi:hypothetical protein